MKHVLAVLAAAFLVSACVGPQGNAEADKVFERLGKKTFKDRNFDRGGP